VHLFDSEKSTIDLFANETIFKVASSMEQLIYMTKIEDQVSQILKVFMSSLDGGCFITRMIKIPNTI